MYNVGIGGERVAKSLNVKKVFSRFEILGRLTTSTSKRQGATPLRNVGNGWKCCGLLVTLDAFFLSSVKSVVYFIALDKAF